VTEAEWNACSDTQGMLEFVREQASERKLRLFAVACCRRIWHIMDEPCQASVMTAENFADGNATEEELNDAYEVAFKLYSSTNELAGVGTSSAEAASDAACPTQMKNHAGYAARDAVTAIECTCQTDEEAEKAILTAQAMQMRIARCVFRNPFRLIAIDPAWRTATVAALAEAIYVERAFDRLPILADALQDAGCTNADILGHCRQGGDHVRGCWVVDLLLGKT
jgi:hypothetical protein